MKIRHRVNEKGITFRCVGIISNHYELSSHLRGGEYDWLYLKVLHCLVQSVIHYSHKVTEESHVAGINTSS